METAMDLKQLRALVTVADTGNVTRASALLNLVQPAVSRQLKLLEDDVGTPLFKRGRHGMELTDAGRSLVEHARRILDDVARARAEIRPTRSGEVAGLVAIGLLASTGELLASPLVRAVAQKYPAIRLRVTVGYAGDVLRWMETGDVDAALLYDIKRASAVQVKPLLSEALWVVGPPSAKLRRARPVTMAQLASKRVVLPSAPHGLRTLIEEAAGAAGVTLDVAAETNELAVQKTLAMEGLGYTILPVIAVASDLASGRLSGAPLAEPEVRRRIVLAVPSARAPSAAARCVMDTLVACMHEAVRGNRWPTAEWLAG
jgi:LysR family nitrogen assimilation transcriptional regulator